MTRNMRVAMLAAEILLEMDARSDVIKEKPKRRGSRDKLVKYMHKVKRAVTAPQVAEALGLHPKAAYSLLWQELHSSTPRISRPSRGVYALA